MNTIKESSTEQRMSALLRIVSTIETATNLDELLLLVLNEFRQLLRVSHGAVIMIDGDRTTALGTYPPSVNFPPPIPLSETPLLQQIIETRHSLQLADVYEASLSSYYLERLKEHDVCSVLMMPIVAQDRVIGFLILGDQQPRTFSNNDVDLARMLTGQVGTAINSFCISDSAQRREAELATLNNIAAAVTSLLDTQQVYHLVVEKLNEFFRVEAGSLLMRDEETGDLLFVMTLEYGVEKLAGLRIPREQGVAGYVAETQNYAIVHNAQDDPRFYSRISEITGYPTHSILCVPMIVKGRTIGVIELLNKIDEEFTEEDAQRLMRMAATVGVAIENARLFQEVANGRELLEAIINSNKDGIVMANMNGVVKTVNPKAVQIFQMPREQLYGKTLPELLETFHNRASEITTPPWVNEEDQPSEIIELEFQSPQPCFIRQRILPVHDSDGVVIGRLVVFQDITGEREVERWREEYTGMIVHDLRSPLTAVMNGILMVRKGMGGPVHAEQDKLLGFSYESSQKMMEIVNTLLDISKMEEGRMTLNIDLFSPYHAIDETLKHLKVSAENRRVCLYQELSVNLPMIEGDQDKFVRILQNLVDNAIKFSPNQGSVTIGAACIHQRTGKVTIDTQWGTPLPVTFPEVPEGDWVVFWVKDDGAGIPANYHKRVFEKFTQVEMVKQRKGERQRKGSGLGLTFCKLAVEAHGGHIWVESEEGKGSTFAFIIPVKQPSS